MSSRFTGLWRHADFRRLWAAETISIFGSLVTRTALPFAAILTLDATAFQISLLGIAELVPAFLVGLVAGVWVDRLPRRPIMIAADLGRALLLAWVPLAALLDILRIEHPYAVAFLTGVLTVFFDVAYQSYLPTLVDREELVEGNSKLTVTASVAEVTAFGTGGWLVQLLTAPLAILIDAITFIASALFVWRIQAPEPPPAPSEERRNVLVEAAEGLRLVIRDPILRALAGANLALAFSFRVFGVVFLLYLTRDLGIAPGIQGLIFAVGGVTSLLGAVAAARVARWGGLGRTLVVGLVVTGIGQLCAPLAWDASALAIAFLVAQQFLVDPAATIFEIHGVSLRQAIAPDRLMGRVTASIRFLEFGAMLLGALAGGLLGESIGLRPTLVVGASGAFIGALWLLLSPIRHLREAPSLIPPEDIAPIDPVFGVPGAG
ncbi:MAG: MFS transporter [Chloroflexota bacterium]|nr:MFS transporter [Chloroflexota bacterium]